MFAMFFGWIEASGFARSIRESVEPGQEPIPGLPCGRHTYFSRIGLLVAHDELAKALAAIAVSRREAVLGAAAAVLSTDLQLRQGPYCRQIVDFFTSSRMAVLSAYFRASSMVRSNRFGRWLARAAATARSPRCEGCHKTAAARRYIDDGAGTALQAHRPAALREQEFHSRVVTSMSLASVVKQFAQSALAGPSADSKSASAGGSGPPINAFGCINGHRASSLRNFRPQGPDAAGEDHLVGRAEVVQIFEAAVRAVAELGAAAVADRLVFADLALGMGQRLLGGETVALRAARDLGPGIQIDVAQLPVAFHEEIARVDVAVVLHHHVAVAGFVHGAVAGLLAGQRPRPCCRRSGCAPCAGPATTASNISHRNRPYCSGVMVNGSGLPCRRTRPAG